MRSAIVKRSVFVSGRNTSISLEDEFWESLREIAKGRSVLVSQLITAISIDEDRNSANLSSAVRLFILRHYRVQQKWDADARTFEFNQVRHAVRASI
jgi:predicted DNA-binding ribbon-helix-helix protein